MARSIPDRGGALPDQFHRLCALDGAGDALARIRRLSECRATAADRQADRSSHLALLGDREISGAIFRSIPIRCGARTSCSPASSRPRWRCFRRLRDGATTTVPGSFALQHPDGRRYDYDFGALVVALDREQRRSEYALVACEPNWIYPLCNTIGAAAMTSHDRMHGGGRWAPLAADFRERLEDEFIDLAGRFRALPLELHRRCVADDRRCAAAGDAVFLSERHVPRHCATPVAAASTRPSAGRRRWA